MYVCGDFNVDLLKVETIILIKKDTIYYVANGFLPQIIKPTPVVKNQSLLSSIIYLPMLSMM